MEQLDLLPIAAEVANTAVIKGNNKNGVKVRILRDSNGAHHQLLTGEIYILPYYHCEKKISISLEIAESGLPPYRTYLSFHSKSDKSEDGYYGSAFPLELDRDWCYVD